MVHARSFVAGSREEAAFLFPGLDPLDWDLREGVAYENRTAHYGRAKLLTVEVRDGRLLLNGAAIKLKGVNRHECTPRSAPWSASAPCSATSP